MPMTRMIVSLIFAGLVLGFRPALADPAVLARFLEATVALEDASVRYDGQYRAISYPMGDVPAEVGVCSDVIIRAYRGIGIDLQALVHEDMRQSFAAYPRLWGLTTTDRNIDHRRVPNLRVFFTRKGQSLALSEDPADYAPGDIVTWNLRSIGSLPHIGIVTDRRSPDGARPLMMHNVGGGQVIEDMLFRYEITGHYRFGLD